MTTELEITEEVKREVKRVVKCDPGYRFPSEEEHERFCLSERVDKGWEWFDGGRWCTSDHGTWAYGGSYRHRYRIKIEPEPFTHKGKQYEAVADPEHVIQAGDIYMHTNIRDWNPVIPEEVGKKVGDCIGSCYEYARPLEASYEGEVGKVGDTYVVGIKDGIGLKIGDKVRVEVVK